MEDTARELLLTSSDSLQRPDSKGKHHYVATGTLNFSLDEKFKVKFPGTTLGLSPIHCGETSEARICGFGPLNGAFECQWNKVFRGCDSHSPKIGTKKRNTPQRVGSKVQR